jgi:hypothetical protein
MTKNNCWHFSILFPILLAAPHLRRFLALALFLSFTEDDLFKNVSDGSSSSNNNNNEQRCSLLL